VAAAAADGVVEALEMGAAPEFFLLVQWHPERMEDQSNPCAGGIAKMFLESVSLYLKQHPTLP
jgi:putative glutamine amidotransferase